MRILLLALSLLCCVALFGGTAQACPSMDGASAVIEQGTQAPASTHGHHTASTQANGPCHSGSAPSTCGDLHACCAVPALRAPQATHHRWPTRIRYVLAPPPAARQVSVPSLDRPPKHSA